MLRVLMIVLPIVIAVYAVIDCIQTEDFQVRGLPKVVWVFVILLFPIVGSIAWFFAGRPVGAALRGPGLGGSGLGGGRPLGRRDDRPRGPDDDPDFLKGL